MTSVLLDLHVWRSLKLRPHKCTIGECTSSFADPSTLIRHEKNVHGHHRSSTSAVPKYSRKTAVKKPVVKLEDVDFADLTMPVSGCSTPGLSDAGSSSGSLSPFPPSPLMSGMSLPSQSSYQLQAAALNEANRYCASNFPSFFPDLAFWSSQQPPSDLFVQNSSSQQQFPAIDSNAVATGFGSTSLDWMDELVSSCPSYSSDVWSLLHPVDVEHSVGQNSSQVWSSI